MTTLRRQAAVSTAVKHAQERLVSLCDFGIQHGIERECLRVLANGRLSQTPHPKALGAALTHPYITTDYSEALPELITPPLGTVTASLNFLDEVHRFVNLHLGDEVLWGASMPCIAGGEKSIPIAQYGTSNIGRMKTIYRQGLAQRYSSLMQTIAGVHYNFSFGDTVWEALLDHPRDGPDFLALRSEAYMGLIRNFVRIGWMLPYLFGASPAICESFMQGKASPLSRLKGGTLYGPYATSLRMSDIGYSSGAQSRLKIGYNSLVEYVTGLDAAIRTPEPLYQAIGVRGPQGYRQLNANLLQIENEYYSNVRPKRVAASGERPARALLRGGVEYVEIRGLDVNPFVPLGVESQQLYWLDSVLLACVLLPAAPISCREEGEIRENMRLVVNEGRNPNLSLYQDNRSTTPESVYSEFAIALEQAAELLDSDSTDAAQANAHRRAVRHFASHFSDAEGVLAAQFMDKIESCGGYYDAVAKLSGAHKYDFHSRPLDDASIANFERLARDSLRQQQELEATSSVDFETYLADYFR